MSSSTIRKAIGVVKDQTSISLAKVAGNVAPDLEVLIVKATNHDTEPAEEKHIRDILHLISQHRGYVTASVYNISKRLNKTHDWVVALKALMLVHRLLVDGDPAFGQEMMYPTRKGTRVLNVSDFRAEALSSYWDHSAFVKNYSLYLDTKLEFIAFERKLTPLGFSQKSKSYGDLYESVKKETKSVMTPVKDMKPDRVLERLNKLIRLIERVLSCRPGGNAKSSKMVLAALYLVLNESFWIYADICEALGVLLDRFSEMEYPDCVKTFDEYVKAAKTIDELVEFYIWSKELGVARASEFPQVHKVTDKILGTLERFVREKKNNLKKNIKENGTVAATGPTVAATENLLDLESDVAPPLVANHANWELALVGSTSAPAYSPAVLALPTPSEDKVQTVVDPQDPFAASLMVPPPPYVQLADLEKRKVFNVQEQQQVWQPYGNHAGYNYAYY